MGYELSSHTSKHIEPHWMQRKTQPTLHHTPIGRFSSHYFHTRASSMRELKYYVTTKKEPEDSGFNGFQTDSVKSFYLSANKALAPLTHAHICYTPVTGDNVQAP